MFTIIITSECWNCYFYKVKRVRRNLRKKVFILFQHLSLSTSKTNGICPRKIENYCVRTGKDKFGVEYYKIWFGIILPRRDLEFLIYFEKKYYHLTEFKPRTRHKIRFWFLRFWNRGKCQKRINCWPCGLRMVFKSKIIRWRSLRKSLEGFIFRLRPTVWWKP